MLPNMKTPGKLTGEYFVQDTKIVSRCLTEYAKGGKLWCYDCNTDLRGGHTTECNDPYIPAPYFYLVLCPQNESHHCLKSVITCTYNV